MAVGEDYEFIEWIQGNANGNLSNGRNIAEDSDEGSDNGGSGSDSEPENSEEESEEVIVSVPLDLDVLIYDDCYGQHKFIPIQTGLRKFGYDYDTIFVDIMADIKVSKETQEQPMDLSTNGRNKFGNKKIWLTPEEFKDNVRRIVIMLEYPLESDILTKIIKPFNRCLKRAPKECLNSFYMGLALTTIFKVVKEWNAPASLIQDTLQTCTARCKHLSDKYNKIVLALIAHDVASFGKNFKNIRGLLKTVVEIPRQRNLENPSIVDGIIPWMHTIYLHLMYDPEKIYDITDPDFVKSLVRCLNSKNVNMKDRHAILEILAIASCHSNSISQMLMQKDSVLQIQRFLGNYSGMKEVIMMDFASLFWAILPAEPKEKEDFVLYRWHDAMREEMMKPFRLPIWHFQHFGVSIPFTPEINNAMEEKYPTLQQFSFINSAGIHTIDFKQRHVINEETSERRLITREFTGYCNVLALMKSKTPDATITTIFAEFVYRFYCARIYNILPSNNPEKFRCLEGMYSLLKNVTLRQLTTLFAGTKNSWTGLILREALKHLLYDHLHNFKILALDMLTVLKDRKPRRYDQLFESEGIMTAIRRIAQIEQKDPINLYYSPTHTRSFLFLQEKKYRISTQANEFIKKNHVKNIPYPKLTKQTKIEELNNFPLDVLLDILMSLPTDVYVVPGSERTHILNYFIHFLTSANGPKERPQRLREFLEVMADIPQVPTNEKFHITKGKFSKLVVKLVQIVIFFLHNGRLWNVNPDSLDLFNIGVDSLQKIIEYPLNICIYCPGTLDGRLINVPAFTSIQYLECFIADKLIAPALSFDDWIKNKHFRIELYINNNRLPPEITIYEAIRRFANCHQNIFGVTHEIIYMGKRLCDEPQRTFEAMSPSLDYHLRERSPCPGFSEEFRMTLQFLDILYGLNEYWNTLYPGYQHQHIIKPKNFKIRNIEAMFNGFLTDPFSVMTGRAQPLVGFVIRNCPFLLTLETRMLAFRVCYMDRRRALSAVIEQYSPYNTRVLQSLNDYPEVEVSRNSVLIDISKALRTTRSYSNWFVTFRNETGSGDGLRNELFTLASRNLQKADLKIWSSAHSTESGYLQVEEEGLYPSVKVEGEQPQFPSDFSYTSLEEKFKTIGLLMGKTLLEGQILDLPLALPVFKWLLNQERYLTLEDMNDVHPSLYKVLIKIKRMVEERDRIMNDTNLNEDVKNAMIKKINVDGETVESYYLNFVLPYDSRIIELVPNGMNIALNLENAHIYLEKVENILLKSGVEKQMNSLKLGLDSIINLDHFRMFKPHELMIFICGKQDDDYWTMKHMKKHILVEGFNQEEKAIATILFELWIALGTRKRRMFLRFITGCSRLPVGGFEYLSPPLRIARCSASYPYAQTCFNTLNIPANIGKDQLKNFINVAITEGLEFFGIR